MQIGDALLKRKVNDVDVGNWRLRTDSLSAALGSRHPLPPDQRPAAYGAMPRRCTSWRRPTASMLLSSPASRIAKELKPTPAATPAPAALEPLMARLLQPTDDLTVQTQHARVRDQRRDTDQHPRGNRVAQPSVTDPGGRDRLADRLRSTVVQAPSRIAPIKGVADRTFAWLLADLSEIGVFFNKAVVASALVRYRVSDDLLPQGEKEKGARRCYLPNFSAAQA